MTQAVSIQDRAHVYTNGVVLYSIEQTRTRRTWFGRSRKEIRYLAQWDSGEVFWSGWAPEKPSCFIAFSAPAFGKRAHFGSREDGYAFARWLGHFAQ